MAKITKERTGKYLKTALYLLTENNGSLPSKEVIGKVREQLDFSEYELEAHEKSGYIRWESILHFYSIEAVKAGWIQKNKGIWYITPEGIDAIKLSDIEFIEKSGEKYAEWKNKQTKNNEGTEDTETEDFSNMDSSVTFEKAEGEALQQIKDRILSMNPYEFQDLVAALLRGMGYHTPFVAPKGKDGGMDILAYKDPLGTTNTRLIVQVKHRIDSSGASEIRELSGLLRRDTDTGLFVACGNFSRDAINEAKNSQKHIETVNLDRFIDLWKQTYRDLTEADKSLLPLREIMFLAPLD